MLGDDNENCPWSCQRSERYERAIECLIGAKRFQILDMAANAERLIVGHKGSPPNAMTVDNGLIAKTELLTEVSQFDDEYNEEHYAHHSKRVKCLLYESILICFSVDEVAEKITFTALEVPEMPEAPDVIPASQRRVPRGRNINVWPNSPQRHLMELEDLALPGSILRPMMEANWCTLQTLSHARKNMDLAAIDLAIHFDGIVMPIELKCTAVEADLAKRWSVLSSLYMTRTVRIIFR